MRQILVLGAGLSSPALINYLIDKAEAEQWMVTVADQSLAMARSRVRGRAGAKAVALDVRVDEARNKAVQQADVVVSLLPPALHYAVACACVQYKKHLTTASYVTPQIRNLQGEARKAGIVLLNEAGLDPGIDHMSAMEGIGMVNSIKGSRLTGFKSFTGGLVAPESNDNPWGYKFTWNPRNVILAGQGTARFIHRGKRHFLPYSRVFTQAERIALDGVGVFDAYANRDSLAYRHHYGLENIPTMIRGTLRHTGFCQAWNVLVKLGLTDDSFAIEGSESMTYAELVDAFLPHTVKGRTLKARLARFAGMDPDSPPIKKVEWTGLLRHDKIKLKNATPAAILQALLERKWRFRPGDRDMVVMVHLFEFTSPGPKGKQTGQLRTWMSIKGEARLTAMARTVGLPLAMATRLILNGKIKMRGVAIPVSPEWHVPILGELKTYGIRFNEKMKMGKSPV